MTRKALLACALAAAAWLGGCAQMGMGVGGWTTLVDGTKGPENFNRVGEANWSATDGAIQATAGGKDPAYVAADADLDFAVANVIDGACYNAGQSCCAVERVYVHRDLHDDFLAKALEVLGSYRLGDPLDEATTMGPLARRSATTR